MVHMIHRASMEIRVCMVKGTRMETEPSLGGEHMLRVNYGHLLRGHV